jgi:hypothetical protein
LIWSSVACIESIKHAAMRRMERIIMMSEEPTRCGTVAHAARTQVSRGFGVLRGTPLMLVELYVT